MKKNLLFTVICYIMMESFIDYSFIYLSNSMSIPFIQIIAEWILQSFACHGICTDI